MELFTEHFMAIALFFSFILLIFYGFPVAWTMGGLGVLFIILSMLSDSLFDTFYGVDWGFASMVVYRLYGVMANWVLVALPMFIFMGIMMDKSGIAEDLMTDLSKLFGKTRGGLAIAIVFIGVLLAASTGIIGAAVVLLTILGVPLMLKNNYNKDLACGVVCATGTLGILIPPSIMLVIMGDQVRISVGDLFMGAVFPGLLLGLLYTIFIVGYAYLKPKVAPLPKDAENINLKIIFRVLKSIIPPALLIVAVLGSIFMGIATPTEASGVGALGASLLAIFRGRLSFEDLISVADKSNPPIVPPLNNTSEPVTWPLSFNFNISPTDIVPSETTNPPTSPPSRDRAEAVTIPWAFTLKEEAEINKSSPVAEALIKKLSVDCLLYTSDAADE